LNETWALCYLWHSVLFIFGGKMPYKVLPARLQRLIPSSHGQRLFMNVFNSQMRDGKSENVSMASAWGALKEAGYKKGPG